MELNLAEVHEAVTAANPDRECIVWGDRRLTYAEVTDRTRRLAHVLSAHGLGCHSERAALAGHESGQDHVALFLYNGNEYLEGMLGAFKARAVPVNVNYRYVATELTYLLTDAGARAVIYHSAFAPALDAVRADLPHLELLLQVADDSGHELLDGALDYEAALAAAQRGAVAPGRHLRGHHGRSALRAGRGAGRSTWCRSWATPLAGHCPTWPCS